MQASSEFGRRRFLAGLAGAMGVGASRGLAPAAIAAPGPAAHVASCWIPRGEHSRSYDLFRRTLEASTDFAWLGKGDRVLLKLSLNSGRPFPATTDPWLLASTIRLLRQKGAGQVLVGDSSGCRHVRWGAGESRGSSRDCCRQAGLLSALVEAGGTPCFFEEAGRDAFFETRPTGEHHWTKPLFVTRAVTAVEHIVYLPRVSSHVLGDASLGLKIGVGFLREDSRRALHEGGADFHTLYGEINDVPEISSRLRLTVSSGREVLAFGGPDSGPIATPDHGLVAASTDLVAHELLAYTWLMWIRRHAMPLAVQVREGALMRERSQRNRKFLRENWRLDEALPVADLHLPPLAKPSDHPAVAARLGRTTPRRVEWESINPHPDGSIVSFLTRRTRA